MKELSHQRAFRATLHSTQNTLSPPVSRPRDRTDASSASVATATPRAPSMFPSRFRAKAKPAEAISAEARLAAKRGSVCNRSRTVKAPWAAAVATASPCPHWASSTTSIHARTAASVSGLELDVWELGNPDRSIAARTNICEIFRHELLRPNEYKKVYVAIELGGSNRGDPVLSYIMPQRLSAAVDVYAMLGAEIVTNLECQPVVLFFDPYVAPEAGEGA